MTEKVIIKPGNGHLDQVLSELILKTVPCLNKLNVTPNMLTTLGLICSVLCVYYFYKNNLLSIPFLLLRMYFDYVDGLYARKYDMTSSFGDYYDHITDFTYFILFVFVIFKTMKGKRRKQALVLLGIFSFAFVINLGCIESENEEKCIDTKCSGIPDDVECREKCNKHSGSLEIPKKMCTSPEFFKFTDNGVLYIVMIGIILLRKKYGKKKNKSLF